MLFLFNPHRAEAKLEVFEKLSLVMSVYNSRRLLVERVQEVSGPLFRRRKYVFWGNTFHLQLPLENVPDKSFIEFTLIGVPFGVALPHESRVLVPMTHDSFSSGQCEVEFRSAPTIPEIQPISPRASIMTPRVVSVQAPPSVYADSISCTSLCFGIQITKVV
jgi:hypothetical protein